MEWLTDPHVWLGFLSLAALEIVLGIDNIVFISILAGQLPKERQELGRQVGILLAMVARVGLLFALNWLTGLTSTLFSAFGTDFSGRDLILIVGGAFLLVKAVTEIHNKIEEGGQTERNEAGSSTLWVVLAQIVGFDLIFSLDSVITAVGLSNMLWVMVAAIVVAMLLMLSFSGPLSNFVNHHPTVKMLALSFLVLIGVNLVAEGFGHEIPKGYTYFAMAFAVAVEMLNLQIRKRSSQAKSPAKAA